MFLNKKSLIIHNQRRAKNHMDELKKKAFKEVEKIVNDEDLSLEEQEAENLGVFKRAYVKILKEEIEFWQ